MESVLGQRVAGAKSSLAADASFLFAIWRLLLYFGPAGWLADWMALLCSDPLLSTSLGRGNSGNCRGGSSTAGTTNRGGGSSSSGSSSSSNNQHQHPKIYLNSQTGSPKNERTNERIRARNRVTLLFFKRYSQFEGETFAYPRSAMRQPSRKQPVTRADRVGSLPPSLAFSFVRENPPSYSPIHPPGSQSVSQSVQTNDRPSDPPTHRATDRPPAHYRVMSRSWGEKRENIDSPPEMGKN